MTDSTAGNLPAVFLCAFWLFCIYIPLDIYGISHLENITRGIYNIDRNQGKGGDKMKVKVRKRTKRRRQKPTAFSERMKDLTVNILSGLISGLITAAILELLGW